MNCPLDGTTLETHTLHSVDVEECPKCKGIWFEKGELSQAKDDAEPELNWMDFDLWADHESFNADWSTRKCPVCGEKMATISYGETGIKVDYCTGEHGVWLDKGEFEAIIDALEKELITMDSSDYARASLKEAKDLAAGDENFASEWNDFHSVSRLLQFRILAEHPKFAEMILALQTSTPFK